MLARETTGINVDHTGSAGLAGLLTAVGTDPRLVDERVAVIFPGVARSSGAVGNSPAAPLQIRPNGFTPRAGRFDMWLRSAPILIAILTLTVAAVVVVSKVRVTTATWPERFLWVAAVSTLSFFPSVVLHNVVSAVLKVEEPVFFIVAVIGAPLGLAAGLVAAAVSSLMLRVHAQ